MPNAAVNAANESALEGFLAETADTRLESFKALLRIASISGIPAHAPDCRAAAEFVAEDLRAAGMEHVDVSETGGHPVVYADWLHAPGRPTVLVYCHYDVQPVDPVELWESPPFVPVVKDGKMLARGSSDDKSQPAHARPRDRGAAEDTRRTTGQHPPRLRGRGGIRAPSISTPGSRPTATVCRPTSRSSPTRASSRATCLR